MSNASLLTPFEVQKRVGNIPHMSFSQAETITDFIQKHKIQSVLELGFRHGVSTCYIAAALDKNGGGSIVTIDLESAKQAKPNIEELLTRIGRLEQVSIYYEPTSYTWRLMRLLESNAEPCFDFCYLDGAHNWFVDGFAFFLVDKLLKLNGWIIFDDLNWSYEKSPSLKNTARVKAMPEDERKTCQVMKVFELLVKTHPCYGNFDIKEGWGFAQKIKEV